MSNQQTEAYRGADWIKSALRVENMSPLGERVADLLGDAFYGNDASAFLRENGWLCVAGFPTTNRGRDRFLIGTPNAEQAAALSRIADRVPEVEAWLQLARVR